ncbi:DUF4105 domain-containing protein [Sinirhodobacter ferrireducens]|uniref:DUF4105 domain-containing protein n=1 Tax=Paenirhodobacter ferrireducens TaxID=1215032 RepID=A0A443L5Z0_9RHOB|nr:DUF4105 domain-containing protein [Sinirhodobacter ferrireducens]RWR44632.1 DUF4105 domain-containing protein [Sinirhodobacter ferrireducens]
MARALRLFSDVLFALVVLFGAAWAATALWLHLTGVMRLAALGVLALAAAAAFLARKRRRRAGWAVLALAALVVASWYQTITPRADRDWAVDVSRGVTARISGDTVTLDNLRDFDWSSADEATPRWITRRLDLNQLDTVDMITSVWDNPDIAHLLVSFGFRTGEHVVFSVEIRREEGEEFNEVGGFFRQFELVLIAATERDILRLRTDLRREEVRMYPVLLSPEQRRTLFLSYVGLAQQLERQPRFYNTLTANCTTVVYGLALGLKSDLPLSDKLILSGRLPEYLEALHVLGGEGTMAERRAAALLRPGAEARHPGFGYSAAIRLK